jgi:hypothetical protein
VMFFKSEPYHLTPLLKTLPKASEGKLWIPYLGFQDPSIIKNLLSSPHSSHSTPVPVTLTSFCSLSLSSFLLPQGLCTWMSLCLGHSSLHISPLDCFMPPLSSPQRGMPRWPCHKNISLNSKSLYLISLP